MSKEEFMERYYMSDAYVRHCTNNYHISVVDKYTGDVVMERRGGKLIDAKQKAKALLAELDDNDLYAKVWSDIDRAGVRIEG